jgi:hypothetical protein
VRSGKLAARSTDRNWKRYCWRGEHVALRSVRPIPPEIMTQIVHQARHDSAVLAAGVDNIFNAGDREGNGFVDVASLQRAIPHGREFLVIVPDLGMQDDQRLCADIVTTLNLIGVASVQTIVADQELENPDTASIPEPFLETNVVFWPNFLIHGHTALRLAQLTRVLRPRVVIVANSQQGFEMVARFGRTLSSEMKLYCLYTNGRRGQAFSARFPRWTLPFAGALTDDPTLAGVLRSRYGDVFQHDVVLLPSTLPDLRDALVALFARP